jgi:hypothetical protein
LTDKVAPVEKTAQRKAKKMPNKGNRMAARSQKSGIRAGSEEMLAAVILNVERGEPEVTNDKVTMNSNVRRGLRANER